MYVRTFKTDILGTEKLMDVALINTIMKQNHIPIENPWLSGFFMNYYYFGHFILALFQYMFQIPTAVGYNLAISLLGVWIVQAGYLVVKTFRFNDLVSLIISLIMMFSGNLYLLVQSLSHTTANQWFASATRVIPYTINEFPSYSVILGDLHGHYLSHPFFLLGIFLLIDIFFPLKQSELKEKDVYIEKEEWILPKSILLGILLGHLYLTNTWDIFTLAGFGALIVFIYTLYLVIRKKTPWKTLFGWFKELGLFVLIPIAVFSIPQFLSSRSYYLPPVGGVGINSVYSPISGLLMLFGQFLIIILLAYLYVLYLQKRGNKTIMEDMQKDMSFVLPTIMVLTGVILIFAVEFIYAKDVFSVLNPPYARTNTVFKIYFHAWSFLALGSVSLFFAVMRDFFNNQKKLWVGYVLQIIFVMVLSVMLSYTFVSIDQYIAPKKSQFTLDRVTDPRFSNGYSYIKTLHKADYDLISYLLMKPFAHIAEIVTYDSYSYFARISAYTGMSTVTGWPLHNVQWYNGYEGKGKLVKTGELAKIEVANRVTDIETLYTSSEIDKVKNLLKKYDIQYVVFSAAEQEWASDKKKTLNYDVYNSICSVDWQKDGATLYKCK